MGDRRKQALRLRFDGKLKLEFHGANIKSDEVAVPRELFAAILERIHRFGVPQPMVPYL